MTSWTLKGLEVWYAATEGNNDKRRRRNRMKRHGRTSRVARRRTKAFGRTRNALSGAEESGVEFDQ